MSILNRWHERFETQNRNFAFLQRQGRPLVALKSAITLDGSIGVKGDQRSWITGERARAYGHFLRLYYDSIIVGQATLINDRPRLLPTISSGLRSPWRIVIDPNFAGYRSYRGSPVSLLETEPSKVVWICTNTHARHHKDIVRSIQSTGAHVFEFSEDKGIIDPKEIIERLASIGIGSVLLEGGGGLYATFASAGLVDYVHIFQAPDFLCSPEKINLVNWNSQSPRNGQSPKWMIEDPTIAVLERDWVVEGFVARG